MMKEVKKDKTQDTGSKAQKGEGTPKKKVKQKSAEG